jgi:hypothetical protein
MARLVAVVESIARPSVTSPLLLYKYRNRNNARHQSRVLGATEGLVGMANGTGRRTAARRGRPDLRDTAAPSAETWTRHQVSSSRVWIGQAQGRRRRRACCGLVGKRRRVAKQQDAARCKRGRQTKIPIGWGSSQSGNGAPGKQARRQARKGRSARGKGVRQEERGRRRCRFDVTHRRRRIKRHGWTEKSASDAAARPRPLSLPFATAPRTILGGARGVLGPKRDISCPSQVCGAAVLPNQISPNLPSSLSSIIHASFNCSETYLASVSRLFPLFHLPFFAPHS